MNREFTLQERTWQLERLSHEMKNRKRTLDDLGLHYYYLKIEKANREIEIARMSRCLITV